MIEPLNFTQLFANTFAGNSFIFVTIIIVIIAALAAKFRMTKESFGVILALFSVIIAIYANWVLFLTVLIGGLVTFFTISKLLKG